MTNSLTVSIRRCTFCEKEWGPEDGASQAELCTFKHAHSNGWYRTRHQVDTITIAVPDDPSGLWAD